MDQDNPLFEAYTLTPSQITSSSDSLFSGTNNDQAMIPLGNQLMAAKNVSSNNHLQEDGVVVIEEPSVPKLAKIANEVIRAQQVSSSEKKRLTVVPPLPIPPAAVVIEQEKTMPDLSKTISSPTTTTASVEQRPSMSNNSTQQQASSMTPTTTASILFEPTREIETTKDQSENINIMDDNNSNIMDHNDSDHYQQYEATLGEHQVDPVEKSSNPNTPKLDMSLHLSALSSPTKPISTTTLKKEDSNLHHLKEPSSSSPPRRPASASSTRSTLSQNPNYMNSTITWSSKESNKSIVDLKASINEPRNIMRFGMASYQNKPTLNTRAPSPSVTKRRVTPRRERIFTSIPDLNLENVSFSTGLGTISLPNYRLTSLKGLGVRNDLKILYIQNNYLTSFKYLEKQPNLEVLYVANNCISSLYGFSEQPKLKLISLEGNPITKHPNYRLMVLIAGGLQLKKIDGELVQYKEREFVKQYVASNEKCVEAIRAGWLLDTTPRTTEEFEQIIADLNTKNMDDRDEVRNSDLFKDLVSGALVKTVTSPDLSQYEEKKVTKSVPIVTPSTTSFISYDGKELSRDEPPSSFSNTFLTNYVNEIKNLKLQLEKKDKELEAERKKNKELKETSLLLEDLQHIYKSDINGLSISLNSTFDMINNVSASLNNESMNIYKASNDLLKRIDYDKVTRTSLLVDEKKMFRIHIRVSNSELIDVITTDQKKALAVYKILHMKVALFNKLKKQKTAQQ
ncbi:hypothetical protein C9374_000300 [Naegleria lovaniensis]|uniref:Leucine-rich repeat-containing protein n=1 Tax=Naegleria lovaniensis TaxID=51637 RepID=A0AA88GUX2_NAELO|nr:uncharacterized protein C9374_000300 [Naegleria lovaniensis]KAG2388861.1 hypothetical protein C9374_000300 [Naegleria lovaniensis]